MFAWSSKLMSPKQSCINFQYFKCLLHTRIHVFLLQLEISDVIPPAVRDQYSLLLALSRSPWAACTCLRWDGYFNMYPWDQVHVCLVLEINVSEAFVMNFRYPNDCRIQDSPWKVGIAIHKAAWTLLHFSRRLATEKHGFVSSVIIQVSEIDTQLLCWHEFRCTG